MNTAKKIMLSIVLLPLRFIITLSAAVMTIAALVALIVLTAGVER